VLARRDEDLGPLQHDPAWVAMPGSARVPLFTDDFSNLLQFMVP
jgi:hypothetical protein